MTFKKKILSYKIFFVIVLTLLLGAGAFFLLSSYQSKQAIAGACCDCNTRIDDVSGDCDMPTVGCTSYCSEPTEEPRPTDVPEPTKPGNPPPPGNPPTTAPGHPTNPLQPSTTPGSCVPSWGCVVNGQDSECIDTKDYDSCGKGWERCLKCYGGSGSVSELWARVIDDKGRTWAPGYSHYENPDGRNGRDPAIFLNINSNNKWFDHFAQSGDNGFLGNSNIQQEYLSIDPLKGETGRWSFGATVKTNQITTVSLTPLANYVCDRTERIDGTGNNKETIINWNSCSITVRGSGAGALVVFYIKPAVAPTSIASSPQCTINGPNKITLGNTGYYEAGATATGGDADVEIAFNTSQNLNPSGRLKYSNCSNTNPTCSITNVPFTPTEQGTYYLYCRGWNDSIKECRPFNLTSQTIDCGPSDYKKVKVSSLSPTSMPLIPPTPIGTCQAYDKVNNVIPITWSIDVLGVNIARLRDGPLTLTPTYPPSAVIDYGLQVWDNTGKWWFNQLTSLPITISSLDNNGNQLGIPAARTVYARTTYDFQTFSPEGQITCTALTAPSSSPTTQTPTLTLTPSVTPDLPFFPTSPPPPPLPTTPPGYTPFCPI